MTSTKKVDDSITEIKLDSHAANILWNLKSVIDKLDDNFNTVRDLILELAKYANEKRLCESDQISIYIKKLLGEQIKKGKISAKWIEDCLPKEYKRKYSKGKSELSSHLATERIKQTSDTGQQLVYAKENQLIDDDLDRNGNDETLDGKYESDTDVENESLRQENADLKEVLLKNPFRTALNLEQKFEVPKDKLIEIIGTLKNCSDKCYLIFSIQGCLIRVEADNIRGGNENE